MPMPSAVIKPEIAKAELTKRTNGQGIYLIPSAISSTGLPLIWMTIKIADSSINVPTIVSLLPKNKRIALSAGKKLGKTILKIKKTKKAKQIFISAVSVIL